MASTSTSSISEDTSMSTDGKSSETTIYVAVGKEFKESKSTLEWTLNNFQSPKKIFIIHVHIPAQTVPMMGGRFPVSRLSEQEVEVYHLGEKEKKEKNMNKYLSICNREKVQAEKLMIEKDDVVKGLTELIAQFGIQRLVMGAAADGKYSKDMKMPRSTKASKLYKEAPPSCQIWFVCRRRLIFTRDAHVNEVPTASDSNRSVQSETSQSKSSKHWLGPIHEFFKNKSLPSMQSSSLDQTTRQLNPPNRQNKDDDFMWEGVPRNLHDSNLCLWSGGDETTSSFYSSTAPNDRQKEDESLIDHSEENYEEDPQNLSLHLQRNSEEDLYEKLEQAFNEAAKLREEAHGLYRKYSMAQMKEVATLKKVHDLEAEYTKEMKLRKEIEEELKREKLEVENLTRRQSEIFEELQIAHNQNMALQHCLDSIKEQVKFQGTRDAEEQYRAGEEVNNSSPKLSNFSEFTHVELHEATRGFESSLCIGEGGYGCVYKGFLHHTTVAIKILYSMSMQGPREFQQEVDILSRVRHPNLVTLIGACSEEFSLIYEFLPNGSLEDRLSCVGNTPPLSWQVRTRICSEICSTLIFLHSNKPQSVVHGDLKPANVLLDVNFTCKLSDFGVSRLLSQSSTTATIYCRTDPKGTLVYMDPEYISSGELTPQSDVYSFGIIILRLLTGRPPLGIFKAVKEALENDTLLKILDRTAGAWPLLQAEKLAKLGIRCCEVSRKNRPDLVKEVWGILEPMKDASMIQPSLGSS